MHLCGPDAVTHHLCYNEAIENSSLTLGYDGIPTPQSSRSSWPAYTAA